MIAWHGSVFTWHLKQHKFTCLDIKIRCNLDACKLRVNENNNLGLATLFSLLSKCRAQSPSRSNSSLLKRCSRCSRCSLENLESSWKLCLFNPFCLCLVRAVLLAFQQSLIVLFLTDACPPRTNLGSTGKHYSSHYSSHYRFAKPLESGVLFPEVKSLPNNWNQFKLFKFFRCQNVMLCDARCPSCLYTVCICHSTAVRFMLSFLSFKSTLKPRSSRRLARYADAPARLRKAMPAIYGEFFDIWHIGFDTCHLSPLDASCFQSTKIMRRILISDCCGQCLYASLQAVWKFR